MKLAVFFDHIAKAAAQQGISLAEMLMRARMMGYTHVEMDYDALAADPSIFEALQMAGMEISSIYCFFDFGRQPQQDKRRALVAEALRVGARKIMPIPGFYSSEDPAAREQERQLMLLSMWALASEAEAAGLTMTIEDYDAEISPIRNSDGMNWFIERIPGLKVTYDTGNFRYSVEDEMHAFDALCGKIVHMHLKDRSVEPHAGEKCLQAMDGVDLYPCAVGSGVVPMEKIFARLKEIGYDGILTVEHFDSADLQANMQASADFVKRYFDFR